MNITELPGYAELKEKLQESIDCGNLKSFKEEIKIFIDDSEDDVAAQYLGLYIYEYYTTYKANAAAGLMQAVLQEKLDLGIVGFPDNIFFRIVVFRGSVDLWECYLEDFAQPYLEKNTSIDKLDFYCEMYALLTQYTEEIDEKEERVLKGVHFNGVFGEVENSPGVRFIHSEDFEIMDNVVEKFNAIIGRRVILKQIEDLMDEE